MLSVICVSLLVAAAAGFECPKDAGVTHTDKYPDPDDCAKFFDCTHGDVAWHKTCGPGTVFNPKYDICDWPANVECAAPPVTEKNCFKACSRLYNPVCGSDGQTYDNDCLLGVATCESEGEVTLKAAGKCEEEEEEKNCFKPCARLFNPVCGSDGTTYGNPCELDIATCKSDGAITQKHSGKCSTEEESAGYDDRKCWKNKMTQKMTLLEGTDERLDGNYRQRENAIEKCHEVAADGAFDYFAVGNKGQCWGGHGDSYTFYGASKSCPKNGKGKYAVVHVYELHKPATEAPEVPVEDPTEACGDEGLTCKTNTQYCSGGSFWTSEECKSKRAEGEFCTSSRQCLSGSCSWASCK